MLTDKNMLEIVEKYIKKEPDCADLQSAPILTNDKSTHLLICVLFF